MSAPAMRQRRDRVRHLAEQGRSTRQIAAEVGVSKDTVRRDLEALRQDAPPGAPEVIPVTEEMRRHLAVFAEAGQDATAAVELALRAVALAYVGAWRFGLYPQGVPPRLGVLQLRPYKPE